VAVSALLFLAIPRFQMDNSLFLERFIAKKARSGFNDSIKFGDVTEILQDNSVAMSVDVSDPKAVPASPYWRMLVLDEYRDGGFRLSPGLSRAVFSPERKETLLRGEVRAQPGAPVFWTFYLESGVSRYLPLLGRFEELRFREVQNFRASGELGLVTLRAEPATMTAYRVVILREGLALSGRHYTREAVQDVARRASGLRCFADHPTAVGDRLQPARTVRDLVGYFADPALREVPGPDGISRLEAVATLHLTPGMPWVTGLAEAATSLGGTTPVGLSIDAMARVRPGTTIVDAVPVVRSCDVVTRASAGGRFLHRIGSDRAITGTGTGRGTGGRGPP
jgi:hypothetical protein